MGSSIKGSGHALPTHQVKNEDFLNHQFFTKAGEKNTKPSRDIVQKLEEISGIRERRYIGEDEESIDILVEASQKALTDASLSPNQLQGIIIAHNTGNVRANLGSCFHPIPNVAAVLKNRLGVTNKNCPCLRYPLWLPWLGRRDDSGAPNDSIGRSRTHLGLWR